MARIWAVAARALDGDICRLVREGKLVWMPSHQPMTAIGEVKLSNGQRLTAVEWRANRLADALAKQAALTRKAPVAVIQTLKSARAVVRHSAALLGQVTHAANNHRVVGWRPDGTAEVKVMRDSQPKDPSTRRVRQDTSDAAPLRALVLGSFVTS